MHIVCQKKGLTQTQALMDPTGFAVLAFFIKVWLNRSAVSTALHYPVSGSCGDGVSWGLENKTQEDLKACITGSTEDK